MRQFLKVPLSRIPASRIIVMFFDGRNSLSAGCVVAGLFLAFNTTAWGNDFCGAWLLADADLSKGEQAGSLQLRSCDLTGGVSAYLQLQNNSSAHLRVVYRVHTEEKTPKEGELTLEPGETKRGATCQQCSRRKGGVVLWEVVETEVLPVVESATGAAPVPPPPPPGASPSAAGPADRDSRGSEVVEKKQETPATEKKMDIPSAPADKRSADSPEQKPQKKEQSPAPWSELPPEFRPRD